MRIGVGYIVLLPCVRGSALVQRSILNDRRRGDGEWNRCYPKTNAGCVGSNRWRLAYPNTRRARNGSAGSVVIPPVGVLCGSARGDTQRSRNIGSVLRVVKKVGIIH